MIRGLTLGLYDLAWTLARPVLHCNRRLADGFAERLAPTDWLAAPAHKAAPVDIWIQAASGGEARLASTLLDALATMQATTLAAHAGSHPPLRVLLTTWTRQGRDILDAAAARLCALSYQPLTLLVRFVPFDAPSTMRKAVAMAQPRLVVLLETELWPGLLQACAQARVPVLVLNARMREQTLRRYSLLHGLWQSMAPAQVAAISDADAARFAALFPHSPVCTLPNIKFDQSSLPAAPASTAQAQVPVILLASVREEEETELCAGLARCPDVMAGRLRLVVAPRHLHRVAAWQEQLAALGLAPVLRSTCTDAPAAAVLARAPADNAPAQPVIWDAFGELPALYAVADAVFVGGSLAPLGGQNFLEALNTGLVPVVGPHLDNFAWALENLADQQLLEVITSPDTLWPTLVHCALHPEPRHMVCERYAAWLAPRRGGAIAQARLMVHMLEHGSVQDV